MSKGSSTTANKQITDDPLNFFCTAEALWLTERAATIGIIISSTYKPLLAGRLSKPPKSCKTWQYFSSRRQTDAPKHNRKFQKPTTNQHPQKLQELKEINTFTNCKKNWDKSQHT
jgi:hypothetical protein